MSSEWIDPYAGFVYDEDQIEITAAHQAEKLAACGIDATAFGGQADPSFFIGLAIHAGIKSRITADGRFEPVLRLPHASVRPSTKYSPPWANLSAPRNRPRPVPSNSLNKKRTAAQRAAGPQPTTFSIMDCLVIVTASDPPSVVSESREV